MLIYHFKGYCTLVANQFARGDYFGIEDPRSLLALLCLVKFTIVKSKAHFTRV